MTTKITEIEQTCLACPSQWEGRLENGRTFYIRYRWGGLSVRVSPEPTEDVGAAVNGEEVFYANVSKDGFDGFISLPEVAKQAGHVLDFSNVLTSEGVEDGLQD